jgi:preprotein translocase subunit SecD
MMVTELVGCSRRYRAVEIQETKLGGLYEANSEGKKFRLYNSDKYLSLDTTTSISFEHFEEIKKAPNPHEGVHTISIRLDDVGTRKFKSMTQRNVGKAIYFVIGEKIIASPITTEVVATGVGQLSVASQKGIDTLLEYIEQVNRDQNKEKTP